MMTRGAIGNLINRYTSVLKKCHLLNTFGSLALAGAMAFCFAVSPVQAAAYDLNTAVQGSSVTINGGGKIHGILSPIEQRYLPLVSAHGKGADTFVLDGDPGKDIEIYDNNHDYAISVDGGTARVKGNIVIRDTADGGITAFYVGTSGGTLDVDGNTTISGLTHSGLTHNISAIVVCASSPNAAVALHGDVTVSNMVSGVVGVRAELGSQVTLDKSLTISGIKPVAGTGAWSTVTTGSVSGLEADNGSRLVVTGDVNIADVNMGTYGQSSGLDCMLGASISTGNLNISDVNGGHQFVGIANQRRGVVTVNGNTVIKNSSVSHGMFGVISGMPNSDSSYNDYCTNNLKGDVDISNLAGSGVYGIVLNYGSVTVEGNTTMKDFTSPNYAMGIFGSNGMSLANEPTLDVKGNLTISGMSQINYKGYDENDAQHREAYGVALGKHTLKVTGNTAISDVTSIANGISSPPFEERIVNEAAGLKVTSGGTLDMGGTTTISGITSNNASYGLYASGDNTNAAFHNDVTISNLSLLDEYSGDASTMIACGVFADDSLQATFDKTLTVSGVKASKGSFYGVHSANKSHVAVAGDVNIANAALSEKSASTGLGCESGASITTGNVNISDFNGGTSATGIGNTTGGVVTVNGHTVIKNLSAQNANGVTISDSLLAVSGDTDIRNLTATGANGAATGLQLSGTTARAEFGGKLSVSLLSVPGGGKSTGILVDGVGLNQEIPNGLNIDMSDGTNTVSRGDAINVSGTGNTLAFGSLKAPVTIIGDLRVADQTVTPGTASPVPNLLEGKFMTPDSYLKGFTYADPNKSRAAGDPLLGVMNLTFANGAFWELAVANRSDAATLTAPVVNKLPGTLSLDNSDVYVGSRKAEFSLAPRMDQNLGAIAPVQLQVNSLEGNGNFHLRADVEKDLADSVYAKTATGNYRLFVASRGKNIVESMNSYLARQDAGNASFALGNPHGLVDAGLYVYGLAQRNVTLDNAAGEATEWYLKRVVEPEPTPVAPEAKPVPSPAGEAEMALSGIAGHYALWYGQQTDLRKRLGEIRYGTQTGLWVRGFADKARLDGFNGGRFTQETYGGSIGYDKILAENETWMWFLGMQLRGARANQRVKGYWGGTGDLNSFGGGIYSTWAHADGWYVDAVATYDHYNHRIRATMLDGVPVSDGRSAYGLGTSLEAGRKLLFGVSEDQRDYWFVEPQLQLSYFTVKGGNFTASNGMTIHQRNMDSLNGRAGFVLGKKFELGEKKERGSQPYVQPYVKAGVNHEFLGDQVVRINNTSLESDLDGTRVYYGAGVDWQVNDNLRLYTQAEREHGSHFTREFNVSAGFKWEF